MKRALILGLLLVASTVFVSKISAADVNEEKLLKDSSRADRYKLVKRDALKELGLDLGQLGAEIVKRFSFPDDADEDSIYGIDLSHHNEDGCKCKVNWAVVEAQKVRFAYLKATQGSTGQDTRFAANWSALENSSIRRGAYHFLSPFSTVDDQVKNFLKTMGTLRAMDLPPVMDIEWTDAADPNNDGWAAKSSDDVAAFALQWLQAIETATGRVPVIYTSRAWWKDRVGDDKLGKFSRYPIWIAQYVPDSKGQVLPKNLPAQWSWKIWQFTESGAIKGGLTGNLDVSVFKGSLDQFHQALGVSLPVSNPMPLPGPMPPPVPMPADSGQKTDPTKDASLTPSGTAPQGGTSMPPVPVPSPPASASNPPASNAVVPAPAPAPQANPSSSTGVRSPRNANEGNPEVRME